MKSSDVDPRAPLPFRSTPIPPPEATLPSVAVWQNEGWTILPEPPVPPVPPEPQPQPEPVPQTVTRAQGKAALVAAGIWHHVLAFVAAIPDPTQQALAEIALNDTQEWRRDSPFLGQAAAALGLTSEQLDDLFRDAQGVVL